MHKTSTTKMLLICLAAATAVCTAGLSHAAAQQPDVLLSPVGGSGGGPFQARCPQGEHLMGLNLRAGHNVDAVQPVCGSASGPSGPMRVGREMPRYGGSGGDPRSLMCPPQTPVLIATYTSAEGVGVVALKVLYLYCGIVAGQQVLSEMPAVYFAGPAQSQSILPGASAVRTSSGYKICPAGMIPVGVHGRSGALVDALGLICGSPQIAEDRSGRTLGKRKRPDPAGERTPGSGGTTSDAIGVRERAAARTRGNPALYDQYVGRYLLTSSVVITVTRQGDKLFVTGMRAWGNGAELLPESDTSFVAGDSNVSVVFERGQSGRAEALSLLGQRAVRMP